MNNFFRIFIQGETPIFVKMQKKNQIKYFNKAIYFYGILFTAAAFSTTNCFKSKKHKCSAKISK